MKVVVVEDERVVAKRVARNVAEALGEECESVTICGTFDEASDYLNDHDVDLLLLDLNLHGADGFDLLSQAAARPSHTIVVSANTDRALQAFEYGVLDFVPKPFTRERFARAIARARPSGQQLEHRAAHLSVRTPQGIEILPVAGVRAIHGAGNYSEVEMTDGRRRLHYKSLDRLGQLLPDDFLRVHRSHIVNLRCADKLKTLPGSRYQLILDDGSVVPVGRTRVAEVRERLI